jgi:hypothetical protein
MGEDTAGEAGWGWWWHRGVGLDVISRRVPRHHWVHLRVSVTGAAGPGHAWMYAGSIRRDAWRLRRFALIVMRMPRQTGAQALARDGKGRS